MGGWGGHGLLTVPWALSPILGFTEALTLLRTSSFLSLPPHPPAVPFLPVRLNIHSPPPGSRWVLQSPLPLPFWGIPFWLCIPGWTASDSGQALTPIHCWVPSQPAQTGKGSVLNKVRPKQLTKKQIKLTIKDYIYERKRNDIHKNT